MALIKKILKNENINKIVPLFNSLFLSIFLSYIILIPIMEDSFGNLPSYLFHYFIASLLLCFFASLTFIKINKTLLKESLKSIDIDKHHSITLLPLTILGLISVVMFKISISLSQTAYIANNLLKNETLFGLLNFVLLPSIVIASLVSVVLIQKKLLSKDKKYSLFISSLIIPLIFLMVLIILLIIVFRSLHGFEIWTDMIKKGTFKIG